MRAFQNTVVLDADAVNAVEGRNRGKPIRQPDNERSMVA